MKMLEPFLCLSAIPEVTGFISVVLKLTGIILIAIRGTVDLKLVLKHSKEISLL